MRKQLLTIVGVVFCSALVAAPMNKKQAESNPPLESKKVVKVEQESAQDEALFLEPFLKGDVKELAGKLVLDVGRGSSKWGVALAEKGAKVYNVEPKQELSYNDALFDRAISVNGNDEELESHFKELARLLKQGGVATIAAPASFDVVFTNGTQTDESVLEHIQTVLKAIGTNENPQFIAQKLEELDEVNRATFVRRNGSLQLVTDAKELVRGEPIWRKELSKANRTIYHCEEEYLIALHNVGLTCEEIRRPCFFGRVKYRMFHASLADGEKGLGAGYIDNNPFTIYHVVKRV